MSVPLNKMLGIYAEPLTKEQEEDLERYYNVLFGYQIRSECELRLLVAEFDYLSETQT
jgi:hypothetical protein